MPMEAQEIEALIRAAIPDADVEIRANHILENRADGGAGIRCSNATALIEENEITGNESEGDSGGIALLGKPSTVRNNTITDNRSDSTGGVRWPQGRGTIAPRLMAGALGPTGPGAEAAGCRADCVMSGSFTGEEESGSRSR